MIRTILTFMSMALFGTFSIYGQEMSLKECINMAVRNNLSLTNARIDMDKGKNTVSQNRAKLLPMINGVFQLTDYLVNPVNVTTGTLLGNDFPDNPTWQTIRSTQYNANAGIQLVMPLYNQTIYAAIDVAKTVNTMSALAYEKGVDDLTLQLGKVYYLAQAAKEQIHLFDDNILRMNKLCEITEALYQGGVVMEVDVNRVRINLKNIKTQRGQFNTLYKQQLNLLRFIMDADPEMPLDVNDMADGITPIQHEGVNPSLPELLLASKQQELIEKRIKTVKAGYLPSIALTGYAGGIGYQEKFGHFFHTKEATQNWFGNCFVGLTVKIPIFEANSKKLQIRQYQYERQQAANRIELQRKQLDESYANAMLQLDHNLEVFTTQSDNYRQAENVYNITEEQYKEGVASMTALLQDEMQMRNAQVLCVQALCQYNIAQLELLKLSGKLDLLSE